MQCVFTNISLSQIENLFKMIINHNQVEQQMRNKVAVVEKIAETEEETTVTVTGELEMVAIAPARQMTDAKTIAPTVIDPLVILTDLGTAAREKEMPDDAVMKVNIAPVDITADGMMMKTGTEIEIGGIARREMARTRSAGTDTDVITAAADITAKMKQA